MSLKSSKNEAEGWAVVDCSTCCSSFILPFCIDVLRVAKIHWGYLRDITPFEFLTVPNVLKKIISLKGLIAQVGKREILMKPSPTPSVFCRVHAWPLLVLFNVSLFFLGHSWGNSCYYRLCQRENLPKCLEVGTALIAAPFCFSVRATLSDAVKARVTQLFLIVHPYF